MFVTNISIYPEFIQFFHSKLILIHWTFHYSENTSKSLSDTIKIGAFVANKQVNMNDGNSYQDIPFSSLLTPHQTSLPSPVSTTELKDTTMPTTTASIGRATNTNNRHERLTNDNTISKCDSQNGSRQSSCSMASANDDFIMVDLVITTNFHYKTFLYYFYLKISCYFNFWRYLSA